MVASLLFVLGAAALPLVALTRSAASIPFVGALVLALSAVGASIATLSGLSVVRVTLGLIVATNVAAIVVLARQRSAFRQQLRPRVLASELGLATWFAIPSLSMLLLFPPAPLGWDARSIWWFHASWFRAGGQVAQDSLGNALLSWSQSDYPAGNPSAIATLWGLTGVVENLELAQALTAVLTALAVASLGLVLVHANRTTASIGAATVLVATAGHLGQGLAAQGYVDTLCAALLVTALAAHLCIREARLAIILGSVALAGASVTKNEGLIFGVVVVIVAIVATRHGRVRVAAGSVVGLAPALLWSLVVRIHVADPIEDSAPMSPDPQLFDRLRESLPTVFREVYPVIGPATLALVLLAVAVILVDRRRTGLLSSLLPSLALLVVGVACAFIASVAYAAGPYDLPWWFATSLERVAVTPELFALASLVTMMPAALTLVGYGTEETLDEPSDPCAVAESSSDDLLAPAMVSSDEASQSRSPAEPIRSRP